MQKCRLPVNVDMLLLNKLGLFQINGLDGGAVTSTGMFVTALHRVAGSPAVGSNSFVDVVSDAIMQSGLGIKG